MLLLSIGRILATTAAIALVATTTPNTAPTDLCEGFLPPNSLRIPVGTKHPWAFGDSFAGGLSEQDFNAVIDRFEQIYRDDFTQAGGTLMVRRLWTSAEVNAYAKQQGGTWYIDMYGGLARHPAMTTDGMALVICHEAGHHLGGAPKYPGRGWPATNEGGADYFATLKCLRRTFAADDNASIVASAQLDPLAKAQCESQFTNSADQLLCERASLASTSVGLVFMDLYKETSPPSFGTPDSRVVSQMFDGHPHTQCRLDTYFNGSICPVDVSAPLSDTDYRQGSCVEGQASAGFRPRCWFKP